MYCTLFTVCQFLQWSSWSLCTPPCEDGMRNRSRELCCYPKTRTFGTRCKYVNCGVSEDDYHDVEACTSECTTFPATPISTADETTSNRYTVSTMNTEISTFTPEDKDNSFSTSISKIVETTALTIFTREYDSFLWSTYSTLKPGATDMTTVSKRTTYPYKAADKTGESRSLSTFTTYPYTTAEKTGEIRLTTETISIVPGVEDHIYDESVPFLFKVFYELATRDEAKVLCEGDGGYLVVIDSQEKQLSIQKYKANLTSERYWIGGHDDLNSGEVSYENGTVYPYTNWKIGKPDDTGNCVGMYNDGLWWDGSCSLSLPYICEYKPFCFTNPPLTERAILTPGGNIVGTKRYYICRSEYSMEGPNFVVCERNRTWSHIKFQCNIDLSAEFQSQFLDPTIPTTCTEKLTEQNGLTIQNGECITDAGERPIGYVNVEGYFVDILDEEFVEELFQLPSEKMNEACLDVANATYLISVIYHTEVPQGAQPHNFNLGLITSQIEILVDTFCPIITELDVKVDPAIVLRNISQIQEFPATYSFGDVIIRFCVPVDDTCAAVLSNENVTFSVRISPPEDPTWNDTTISVLYFEGRVYVYYQGLLRGYTLNMHCDNNSTNFVDPSCNDNYGFLTSTVETKTMNKSNGGWDYPEEKRFKGIDKGQIVFKSKFFSTDGFNLFIIPPEPIRFDDIIANFDDRLMDSYVVLVSIVSLLIILTVLTILTCRLDRRDAERYIYHRLRDSRIPCDTSFLISFQTGLMSSKDFTSPLFIEICGLQSSSGVRTLNFCQDGVVNLTRASTSYFYMSVMEALGPIQSVRLWHDEVWAGILVDKIVIKDISTRKSYIFLVNEWLSFTKGWKLHTSIRPSNTSIKDGHILYPQLIKHKIFDDLLLLSVFVRPAYDCFTRAQRLYCLSAVIGLSMLTSAMWFNSYSGPAIYGVNIGPVCINYKQVYVGIMSALLSSPPLILVILFFRNSKKRLQENRYFASVEKAKMKSLLPWCFQVFSWIVVICIILVSAFIIFMYSLQWGGDLSTDWLISIAFGLLFDVITGPLKIAFFCAVLAGLFKRKATSEISVMPAIHVSNEVQITDVYPTSTWPGHFDTKETKMREKRMKLDHKFYRVCRQMVASILYLAILCAMASHNNPNASYYQNSMLLKNLESEYKANDIKDIQTWIKSSLDPFLSGIDSHVGGTYEPYMTADSALFLIGLARIRQIRIKDQGSCVNLGEYELFSTTCLNLRRHEAEDTENYCTGWNPSDVSCNAHSWLTYTDNSNSTSFRTFGEFDNYHGGGYIIDIDPVYTNMTGVANQIISFDWLDDKTRFVSVEATVANPGSRLFSMISFKWEISSIGAIRSIHRVTSLRLYPYLDALDYLVLTMQLLFIFCTLAEVLIFLSKIWKIRSQDGQRFLLLVNGISIMMSFVTISIFSYRIDRTIYIVEMIYNNKDRFFSFDELILLDDLYRTLVGLLVFVHIVSLLRHFTYNYQVYIMHNTIAMASVRILSCSILIGIAIAAFASLEYLQNGRKSSDYRNMYNAIVSLVCAIMSLAKLTNDNNKTSEGMNNIIFILFCLLINFILINLLVSILNETMAALKSGVLKREKKNQFDKKMNRHVFQKFRGLVTWLCSSSSEYPPNDEKNRKQSLTTKRLRTVSNFCSVLERITVEDSLMKC